MSVYIVTFAGVKSDNHIHQEIVGLFRTEEEAVNKTIDFLEANEMFEYNRQLFECNGVKDMTIPEMKEIVTKQSEGKIEKFKKIMNDNKYIHYSYDNRTFSFNLCQLPKICLEKSVYAMSVYDANFYTNRENIGLFETELEAVESSINFAYNNDMFDQPPSKKSFFSELCSSEEKLSKEEIKLIVEKKVGGTIEEFIKCIKEKEYFYHELSNDTFAFGEFVV